MRTYLLGRREKCMLTEEQKVEIAREALQVQVALHEAFLSIDNVEGTNFMLLDTDKDEDAQFVKEVCMRLRFVNTFFKHLSHLSMKDAVHVLSLYLEHTEKAELRDDQGVAWDAAEKVKKLTV
jgi:hypothetical protein